MLRPIHMTTSHRLIIAVGMIMLMEAQACASFNGGGQLFGPFVAIVALAACIVLFSTSAAVAAMIAGWAGTRRYRVLLAAGVVGAMLPYYVIVIYSNESAAPPNSGLTLSAPGTGITPELKTNAILLLCGLALFPIGAAVARLFYRYRYHSLWIIVLTWIVFGVATALIGNLTASYVAAIGVLCLVPVIALGYMLWPARDTRKAPAGVVMQDVDA